MQINIAPAGVKLKPTADAITGTVISCKGAAEAGFKLIFKTDSDTRKFEVGKLARIWVAK